jgi:superfamily II DNA or RNA helicase
MVKLRDYQQQTIDNVFSSYERGIASGIIKLATGLGKTVLATEIAKRWKAEGRGKFLFLVDQIDLAYQARGAFKKSFPNMKIGLEMNSHHSEGDEDIIISCVPSIGRKGSKRIGKFSPDDFTAICADEAHKSLSDSWLRVLHYLGVHPDNFTEGKLLIGLTATPQRKGGGLGFLYHDFYANYDVIYGMREGWLVTPEWIKIRTNVDISEVKKKGEDYSASELEELAEILATEQRNKLILKAFKDEGEEKTIVYCTTVAHAYQVKEMFDNEGIRAEVIEANTDKENRKDWMKKFRDGEDIKVLTNFGTLSTGIDFPDLRCIVLARPIGSDVLYQQILGRVLRPSSFSFVDAMPDAEARKNAIAMSDKPYAKVVDLVDTCSSGRLKSPLTLLGINDQMKTKDRVKVFEQVYEPLEKVKREHGINITEITDMGDLDAIVTRQRGISVSLKTPDNLIDLTNIKWLAGGEDEYEVILGEAKKTLLVTKNLVDKWELHEYDLTSKSGAGKLMNTFNSLAGALRVADEYIGGKYKEDFKFVSRSWAQQNKPPSEKQLEFIKKLWGRAIFMEQGVYYDLPGGGKTHYVRHWKRGFKGEEDILIDTMEIAGNIINTRINR